MTCISFSNLLTITDFRISADCHGLTRCSSSPAVPGSGVIDAQAMQAACIPNMNGSPSARYFIFHTFAFSARSASQEAKYGDH